MGGDPLGTPRLRLALTSFYLPSDSKIGAGYMSHRLANALSDRGNDVTMFSPAPAPGDARYQHHQVVVPGKLRIVRWAWAMRRLDLSGFDALIAQGDDHLVRGGAAPVHIRTLHGSCFDEARHVPGLKNRLRMVFLGLTELLAAIRTPIVVGVSQSSLRYFPWCRTVIPNGVDTARFRPDPTVSKDPQPTILFVGTYERRKRGKLLHETFRRDVLPAIPEARLWMVCDDAPPAQGIEVLGRVSDEELAERYRRAWVFCLPSSYEGFGVPYAEALVSGTAVVATPNPGALEVLDHGRLGVIAPPEQLGRALVSLLTDESRRRELERTGLQESGQYSFDSVAARYEALVTERRSMPNT